MFRLGWWGSSQAWWWDFFLSTLAIDGSDRVEGSRFASAVRFADLAVLVTVHFAGMGIARLIESDREAG